MSKNHPFRSRRGQKIRRGKLLESPLCEDCLKRGRVRPADVVHHTIPVEHGGPAYDPENLESLCSDCHAERHGYGVKAEVDPVTGLPRAGAHPWQEE